MRFSLWGSLGALAVLLAAAVVWVVYSQRRADPPSRADSSSRAAVTPRLSVNDAGYLGPQACAECHTERVESFLRTAHFRTSRWPVVGDLTGDFKPGDNIYHTRDPNLHFEMTIQDSRHLQTAVSQEGSQQTRRTEEIGLVYGAGTIDEVYHYWQQDRLFQLPIAYLNPIEQWGNAPNYRDGFANFSRETLPACLECHNTYVEHVAGTANRYVRESMVLGVTCERCHGPGARHVEYHRDHPEQTSAEFIVHPGELSRQRELDICLQCHSEIENRRRPPFTYRPGESLEDYFRTHGDRHPEDDISANQIEGLSASACFQNTQMTCNDCHDPHVHEGPHNSGAIENSCLSCHERVACHARTELPEAVQDACIQCHMPPRPAMNFTFHTRSEDYLPLIIRHDHRIAIHPAATQAVLADYYLEQSDGEQNRKGQELRDELANQKRREARSLAADYRLRASVGAYREARRLAPDDPQLEQEFEETLGRLNQLVGLLREASEAAGREEYQAAAAKLSQALEIKPNHTSALNGLGMALERQGRGEQAANHYRRAIQVDPEFVDAYYNLGSLLQSRGDLAAAAEQYERAASLAPFQTDVRMNLGSVYFLQDRAAEAVRQFQQAVAINPNYAEGHFNLAVALQSQQGDAEAAHHLRRALAIAPNWDVLYQQLAQLQATSQNPEVRNPAEAIRNAEMGCRLTEFRDPRQLDTLALSLAAAGRFSQAQTAADSALSLAIARQDNELAGKIRRRRRAYRDGRVPLE